MIADYWKLKLKFKMERLNHYFSLEPASDEAGNTAAFALPDDIPLTQEEIDAVRTFWGTLCPR